MMCKMQKTSKVPNFNSHIHNVIRDARGDFSVITFKLFNFVPFLIIEEGAFYEGD